MIELPARVLITEVGMRDGFQFEQTPISTERKLEVLRGLLAAGVSRIQVTSFVHPKWVPQMADAAQVMAGIARKPGVAYAVLTPNLKGYEGARAAGAGSVAIFASASETFAQKNTNCSIEESFERFAPVMEAAKRSE